MVVPVWCPMVSAGVITRRKGQFPQPLALQSHLSQRFGYPKIADQAEFRRGLSAGVKRTEVVTPCYFEPPPLGVVPYLSRESVFATLSLIARMRNAEVVFDYGEPGDADPPARRAGYKAMIARAAAVGEPWLSFFVPEELEAAPSAICFDQIEDLSPRDIAIRYFGSATRPGICPVHILSVLYLHGSAPCSAPDWGRVRTHAVQQMVCMANASRS